MLLTEVQLQTCIPTASHANIIKFLLPLNTTMERFRINTPARMAAFLAQITHESGSLHYVEEIASGEAYEGRKDLGNTKPGDGQKFKGRGLIQLTGRANYDRCGKGLGIDLIENPKAVCLPFLAADVSGWFWNEHNLNSFADVGLFGKITRVINGGYNGSVERVKYYNNCRKVLKVVV